MGKRHYKFTNREYSPKSIMSTTLGAISMASIVLTIILAFQNGGDAQIRYGLSALLASIFTITGLILGIVARMEKDKYYLFANLGIVLNSVMIVILGFLLGFGIAK